MRSSTILSTAACITMRLNLEQDEVMNGVIHDLAALSEARDIVVGSPLTRQDMQRIAKAAMERLSVLWDQIAQGQPTLGYAPCPWNEKHAVGMITEMSQSYVCCMHTDCPMHRARMSMEEWNRRE